MKHFLQKKNKLQLLASSGMLLFSFKTFSRMNIYIKILSKTYYQAKTVC